LPRADFHRSVRHLLSETPEGVFHFDSRLWRTLPALLLNTARLPRACIEGTAPHNCGHCGCSW
jgi:hypothetical protein